MLDRRNGASLYSAESQAGMKTARSGFTTVLTMFAFDKPVVSVSKGLSRVPFVLRQACPEFVERRKANRELRGSGSKTKQPFVVMLSSSQHRTMNTRL